MVLLGVRLNQGWEDRNPEGSRLPESCASASYKGACPQSTKAQAMLGSNALSVACSLRYKCTRRPRRGDHPPAWGSLRSRAEGEGREGGRFLQGARPRRRYPRAAALRGAPRALAQPRPHPRRHDSPPPFANVNLLPSASALGPCVPAVLPALRTQHLEQREAAASGARR